MNFGQVPGQPAQLLPARPHGKRTADELSSAAGKAADARQQIVNLYSC